jgi:DNA invertase Pin-like site-specific DNA recombinase
LLAGIETGDVVMVTRLDRLARSTRDLLNTLAAIADPEGRFPIARRHMGRYDDPTRPPDAGRARRPGRV